MKIRYIKCKMHEINIVNFYHKLLILKIVEFMWDINSVQKFYFIISSFSIIQEVISIKGSNSL